MRKTLLHSAIACCWVVITAFVVWPELDAIKAQNAGVSLFWLILFISIAIILVPQLTRLNLIRRLFCWPDAMSRQQKFKLKSFDLRGYYSETKKTDYLLRLAPYFKFYCLAIVTLFAVDFCLFYFIDKQTITSLLLLAIECYLIGVLMAMLFSLPLGYLLSQREKGE